MIDPDSDAYTRAHRVGRWIGRWVMLTVTAAVIGWIITRLWCAG